MLVMAIILVRGKGSNPNSFNYQKFYIALNLLKCTKLSTTVAQVTISYHDNFLNS